jgi:hypothetical protein
MIKKFQDLDTITIKEVNAALLRDDPHELELVSITIALSELDFNFTQSICIRLSSSSYSKVRGNALVSLGHLARRYLMLDEQFLHWDIKGHSYG